jgi:hypothetical protein
VDAACDLAARRAICRGRCLTERFPVLLDRRFYQRDHMRRYLPPSEIRRKDKLINGICVTGKYTRSAFKVWEEHFEIISGILE